MNDATKEKWIDDVMGSTRGMAKAQPGDGFFDKVTFKTNNPAASSKVIIFPLKQWAAAAILLLALNIGSIVWFAAGNKKMDTGATNPIRAALQSESTYNY